MALNKMALAAALIMLLGITTYSQNCVITCPENIIVTADPGKEGTTVKLPSLALAADCGNYTYAPASGSFFRLGTHSIIMTTASGQKCSFSVIVTDNEPPVLSPLTLSRRSLWPASNKMKKTKVRFSTSDNGGLVTTAIAVNSNATDGIKDWEMIETTVLQEFIPLQLLPPTNPAIKQSGVHRLLFLKLWLQKKLRKKLAVNADVACCLLFFHYHFLQLVTEKNVVVYHLNFPLVYFH